MTEFSPGTSPPPVRMPIRFFDMYDSLIPYSGTTPHLSDSRLATSSQGNPHFVYVEPRPQWIGELLGISPAVAANRILRNRLDSEGRCPRFLTNLAGHLPGYGTAALANMH